MAARRRVAAQALISSPNRVATCASQPAIHRPGSRPDPKPRLRRDDLGELCFLADGPAHAALLAGVRARLAAWQDIEVKWNLSCQNRYHHLAGC